MLRASRAIHVPGCLLMCILHTFQIVGRWKTVSPECMECRATIYDDSFIRQYIDDLLKNIRTQVVMKLIEPYTRIRIPFVSKELNIPAPDVEQLLVSLILDNRIQGHIDQVRTSDMQPLRSCGLAKTIGYKSLEAGNHPADCIAFPSLVLLYLSMRLIPNLGQKTCSNCHTVARVS